MAESVDALVSNTSGAIRAGSTPALGTESQVKNVSLGFFVPVFLFGYFWIFQACACIYIKR